MIKIDTKIIRLGYRLQKYIITNSKKPYDK